MIRTPRPRLRTLLLAASLGLGGLGVAWAAILGTTANDFAQPGTQPGTLTAPIQSAQACTFCHAYFDPDQEPYERWAGSMMANSMRDPVFHAALNVATEDMAEVGVYCVRCHSPSGWLEGRTETSGPNALAGADYEGVNCNFCHRLVDPIGDPANPFEDAGILASLSSPPATSHNGQYVVDPEDRRRGPFDLGPNFPWHEWRQSPYHRESLLCASCHEVSNPAFTRVGGPTPSASDSYALNTTNLEHPTHAAKDEFPVERTFSEWALSDFALAPIDLGGRFGGNDPAVSTCQDCHMPTTTGEACAPGFGGELRDDLPQHDFNGANSWVPLSIFRLDASFALYGPTEATGLPLYYFQNAVDRNVSMLERACDLEVGLGLSSITARITNQSGHKLPTGYVEGRRMWINVQFLGAGDQIVQEHGHYDALTADLTTVDTKVYEALHGLDAAMAAQTGLPAGPSLHFALNNRIYKDNRIPPRGFQNAAFEAAQAHPVGATYADGQHWDDTDFAIPPGAVKALVRVFHQTSSKEYMEFLLAHSTNGTGQIAYDEWVAGGMSAPVEMASAEVDLFPRLVGDVATISVAGGGQQVLSLVGGAQNAGKIHWVLGSITGSSPGFVFQGVHVPLNIDNYTLTTITLANVPPLVGGLGLLDGAGNATATFVLQPGGSANLVGLTLNHAYGVALPGDLQAASNAVGLELVP